MRQNYNISVEFIYCLSVLSVKMFAYVSVTW